MRPLPRHAAASKMSRASMRSTASAVSLSRRRATSPSLPSSSSSSSSTSASSPLLVRRQARSSPSRLSALPPGWSRAFDSDDDESNPSDNDDDREFVYEKVTLLTTDGLVSLPGRKVRRRKDEDESSLGPRARWRRERRREERERRASAPPRLRRRSLAERAAIRALEDTLPGTWAPFSDRNSIANEQEDEEESSSSSSPSPLLVFASPFAVSASNGVDRGRVVRLDGYTRCPDSLGAAVELAARSLRGGVVSGGVRRRAPPRGSHLRSGLIEVEVELPALHGVPPALDAFVAALGAADGTLGFGGDGGLFGDGFATHVVERIVKQWHFNR